MATGVLGPDIAYVGPTGPTGTVASSGSDTQVMFNDAGVLAGDAGLTYNKTTDALTVAGAITSNGNLQLTKTDPLITLRDTGGGSPGVLLYDTTDGGAMLWDNNGATQLDQLNASGAGIARYFVIAKTTGQLTLDNLAGTGSRVVEATSTGVLFAANKQGLDMVGGGTFSGVSAYSIDNVFSATYTNYQLVIFIDAASVSAASLVLRFRVSGADDSAASDYNYAGEYNSASAVATPTGVTAGTYIILVTGVTSGTMTDAVYQGIVGSPFSASSRSTIAGVAYQLAAGVNAYALSGGGQRASDKSHTGLTILPTSGTITGSARVYALRDA